MASSKWWYVLIQSRLVHGGASSISTVYAHKLVVVGIDLLPTWLLVHALSFFFFFFLVLRMMRGRVARRSFQGEESKIIIISLVRSNSAADIGFLRSSNRYARVSKTTYKRLAFDWLPALLYST